MNQRIAMPDEFKYSKRDAMMNALWVFGGFIWGFASAAIFSTVIVPYAHSMGW